MDLVNYDKSTYETIVNKYQEFIQEVKTHHERKGGEV
jgi:sulfate adenylyltransferase subunit 1 (EFTu-like GTPase family)